MTSEFKCRENCGQCCGVVPIPKALYEKYKAQLPPHRCLDMGELPINLEPGVFVVAFTEDFMCAFLNDEHKCIAYEDRPQLCRLYGDSPAAWVRPSLMCPYFFPDGSARSRQSRRQLMREMDKQIKKFMIFIESKKDEMRE